MKLDQAMTQIDPRLHAYRPDLAAWSLKDRVRAARYVTGDPAQVIRGVADLRRAPGAGEKLDSQLLCGEIVILFDQAEGWAWVQNQRDGYVGYVESAALTREVRPTTHEIAVLRSFVYPAPDLKTPPCDCLTMAGAVTVVGAQAGFSEVRWGAAGSRGWIFGRHLAAEGETATDYVATALEFLGVPYLWGGKSSLGLDCSGLVQIALRRAAIPCPRDSDMQAAALGEPVPWQGGQGRPRRGDLIFFPDHVVIALDETRVVNANAHAMLVTVEPLAEVAARVAEQSGGQGITAVRCLLPD